MLAGVTKRESCRARGRVYPNEQASKRRARVPRRMPRYDTLCSGVCQLLSAFYRRTMHKSPTVPASTPTAWMAEGKERMPVPTIALNVVENELSRVQHRDPEGLEATLTPPIEINSQKTNFHQNHFKNTPNVRARVRKRSKRNAIVGSVDRLRARFCPCRGSGMRRSHCHYVCGGIWGGGDTRGVSR
jgi:hypothetical protein